MLKVCDPATKSTFLNSSTHESSFCTSTWSSCDGAPGPELLYNAARVIFKRCCACLKYVVFVIFTIVDNDLVFAFHFSWWNFVLASEKAVLLWPADETDRDHPCNLYSSCLNTSQFPYLVEQAHVDKNVPGQGIAAADQHPIHQYPPPGLEDDDKVAESAQLHAANGKNDYGRPAQATSHLILRRISVGTLSDSINLFMFFIRPTIASGRSRSWHGERVGISVRRYLHSFKRSFPYSESLSTRCRPLLRWAYCRDIC